MKLEEGLCLALEARWRSEEEDHTLVEAEEEARLVEEEARLVEEARLKAEEEEQAR